MFIDSSCLFFVFFFNHTATTEIYTLSLHDALPLLIFDGGGVGQTVIRLPVTGNETVLDAIAQLYGLSAVSNQDRKSTRLNSSHRCISYAVFCLKKKNKKNIKLQCLIISE